MSSVASNGNGSFRLALDETGERLEAYSWALNGRGWRAWSPFALRILRKHFSRARSHLELTDDVVSTLYDPQGEANLPAAFSIANVPEMGLLQLYGAYADGPDRATAVRRAHEGSRRLLAVLKGRFRQSRFSFLAGEEAVAYYQHLWACRRTAALIGQMVPRVAPGMGSMDGGISQLITTDAQEQLEVVAAALAGIPYAVLIQASPMYALRVREMIRQTADALSYFASKVKQGESASLSVVLPSFINPIAAVTDQSYRSSAISRSRGRSHEEQTGHRLAAGQSNEIAGYRQRNEREETHRGAESTDYSERQHLSEDIREHEDTAARLERDYAEQYQLERSYRARESGVLQETGVRANAQAGSRQQQLVTDQQAEEQGRMAAHDSIDESTSGQRGASGSRSGAGSRSSVEHFSEGAAFTTTTNRAWSGDFREETDASFEGSGVQSEFDHYEGAQHQTRQVGSDQSYDRSAESDVRSSSVEQETYARESTEANLSPNVLGMGGGIGNEVGERGAIVEGRNEQSAAEQGSEQRTQRSEGVTVESGWQDGERAYSNEGAQAGEASRAWEGSEQTTTTQTRSGGGTRRTNANYGYSENYRMDESYYDRHHTERDAVRDWDSQVQQHVEQESAADWDQRTRDRYRTRQSFVKSYAGHYSEQGSRQGHLVQDDRITRDTRLQREINRAISGHREESFAGHSQQEERAQGVGARQEVKIGEGREYAQVQARGESGAVGVEAGRVRVTSRGVAGPGGGSIIAGLGFSRQIHDAAYDFPARLLAQQGQRLEAGLTTGMFLTQVTLLAPDEVTLQQLGSAMVAAMREENVVVPVAVRSGDEELWARAVHLRFDARGEQVEGMQGELYETYRHAQLLNSNELAALVHPLRVSSGTISASLEAWPNELSRRRTKGEIPIGHVLDINVEPDPHNVHRIPRGDLMHGIIIGASGSGKSNSALWILAQVINMLRVDEEGYPLPVLVQGPLQPEHVEVGGVPEVGITVFDPTREWRKLGKLIAPREFRLYSLTDPDFNHIHFNPLRIPSPFISPKDWAASIAKRWALAYATGATGFHHVKGAVLDVYRRAGVVDDDGQVQVERSAQVSMAELYEALQERHRALERDHSDRISAGVVKRILDKMEEFVGYGAYARAFGRSEGTTVEQWMTPHAATVLEGNFREDSSLKQFIIGLMTSAIFQHAEGRYDTFIRHRRPIPKHLLFFEEAHVVMQSPEAGRTDVALAVEKGSGLWDDIWDRGRKFGLYGWAAGQHLTPMPQGVITSSRIAIFQAVDTLDDAEMACAKMGKLPGKTSMDEYHKWTLRLLNMPQGVGFVRRARKTIAHEQDMEIFPVNFIDISQIQPPSDAELEHILKGGRG